MPTTFEEIESFRRFAQEQVHHSDPAPTLEECLEMWRAAREREETIADVRRGVADMEAGRSYTLEEVERMFREEFGLAPRKT